MCIIFCVTCLPSSTINATQLETSLQVHDNMSSITTVRFTRALKLEDMLLLLSEINADVAIIKIETEFNVGQRSITEFYALPSHTSVHDIDAHYLKEKYSDYRRSMMETVLKSSTKLDITNNTGISMLQFMSNAIVYNEEPNILLKSVTLVGSYNMLSAIDEMGRKLFSE